MRKTKTPGDKSWTLTLAQYCDEFRKRGIAMDNKRLSDGIKAGLYPGRVACVGPTGRTTFEVWRVEVDAFFRAMDPNRKEDEPA